MPDAPFTAKLFARLVAFYRACVEEEDRRALQLPADKAGKAFVAPWIGDEPLFGPGADACALPTERPGAADFVAKGQTAAGADAAFYAYPLYLDDKGYLAPLFFAEVDLVEEGDGCVLVRRKAGSAVGVNHHLFRRKGYADEEVAAIQEDLEGAYATFSARLAAALAYLEGDAGSDETEALSTGTAVPLEPGLRRPGWIPTPILFRSAYGAYTYNLRKDLDALGKYAFLQQSAAGTAFAALCGRGHERAPADPAEVLPLNEAQEAAARAALSAPLTVVTGPPGTGKSQVVVDLLATAILSGEAVLFASKNAKAVDVVRHRLRDVLGDDLDFTLRLGNRKEMCRMPGELDGRLAALETAGPPTDGGAGADIDRLRGELATLRAAHLALDVARAREREAAAPVPAPWREATGEDGTWAYPLRDLRAHLDRARALAGEARLGVVLWVQRLFMGDVLRKRLADALELALATAPPAIWIDVQADVFATDGYAPLVAAFRRLVDYHGWLAARDARQDAEDAFRGLLQRADTYDDEVRALKEELAMAYRARCRAVWARRVFDSLQGTGDAAARYFAAAEDVKQFGGKPYAQKLDAFEAAQRALAGTLPVWVVTSLSARNALPLRPALFDLVVIDEASQCDVASALPLLFRARRAVVIGDPKQLRHISALTADDEARIAQDTNAEDLLPDWSYRARSLYDVAEAAGRRAGAAPHFLDEHHRSHPAIIGFSNGAFYGGRLHVRTDVAALAQRLGGHPLGVRWHPVSGRVPPSARSAYNPEEIDAIIALLGDLHGRGLFARRGVSVGVVTPFRAQAERVRERVARAPWFGDAKERLVVGTAHAFQGDECDVLLFSPVVGEGIRPGARRWVAETEQLLNVAVTRARGALHVVGDPDACRAAGGPLAELVAYTAGQPAAGDGAPR